MWRLSGKQMLLVINLEGILGKVERPRKRLVGTTLKRPHRHLKGSGKGPSVTKFWKLESFSIIWNMKGKA